MKIEWNEVKNERLKKERGIDFETIAKMIKNNEIIDLIPNINYKNQHKFVLKINNYIYCVPFVIGEDGTIFLKTAYKSRKLNKIYNPKD